MELKFVNFIKNYYFNFFWETWKCVCADPGFPCGSNQLWLLKYCPRPLEIHFLSCWPQSSLLFISSQHITINDQLLFTSYHSHFKSVMLTVWYISMSCCNLSRGLFRLILSVNSLQRFNFVLLFDALPLKKKKIQVLLFSPCFCPGPQNTVFLSSYQLLSELHPVFGPVIYTTLTW